MSYRSCKPLNDIAGSGTFEPLLVTRWRGMLGPSSFSSSSSSTSEEDRPRFLFSLPELSLLSNSTAFRFVAPPWAYLKKSSSGGSWSPSSFPFSVFAVARFVGCVDLSIRNSMQYYTHLKDFQVGIEPSLIESHTSTGQELECFHA